MISEPTVLILGAGASAPFAFPTAKKLLDGVLAHLGGSDSSQQLVRIGFQGEHINAFREALASSGRSSVDVFLEHRTEFMAVGKAAMAQALIGLEAEGRLFSVAFDETNWYKLLFSHFNAPFESFGSTTLAVVTFNYDRSFEHFLFTALKNSYGRTDRECANQVKSIPLVHVHGQLGFLPWQGAESRPYKAQADDEAVALSGRRIKVVSEGTGDDKEFQRAQELIDGAKRVIFLGFGYLPANLKRLGVPGIFKGKVVLGSGYGMKTAERRTAWDLLHTPGVTGPIPCPIHLFGAENEDVRGYLREHVQF